ncbi:MAG: phage major capsid protein [Thermoleophilia bacterium]
MNPKLRAAREAYRNAVATLRAADEAYQNAPETMPADEVDGLWTAFQTAETEAERCAREVERLEQVERARTAHPAPSEPAEGEERGGDGGETPDVRVGAEPATYQRHDLHTSFFLDMARVSMRQGITPQVRERLQRHGREMVAEAERRDRIESRHAERELDDAINEVLRALPPVAAGLVLRALEQQGGPISRRGVTRLDGSAGEFMPPLWMLEDYAALVRANRPFADACRGIPLPAGTDSISVPRITQGGLAGFQTGDLQTITSQDMTSAMVTAPVRTIAGFQDYALQVLEQSPVAFDQIIFPDLFADMDLRLDLSVLNGTGVNDFLGVLNTPGINSVAYTDASPTVPELWPKIADALNQVANGRKRVPTHLWMATRRWFWGASQLDTAGRPFFMANSNGPNNALATFSGGAAEVEGGPVTNLLGVNTHLENSMPTTLGGGTNEDRIITSVMSDHLLFEGGVRAEAFKEILSDKIGVRFRVYKYAAFTAGRYPAATAVIAGTGLATPTF